MVLIREELDQHDQHDRHDGAPCSNFLRFLRPLRALSRVIVVALGQLQFCKYSLASFSNSARASPSR
jgi:hypothetical protein